jgi:RNA polymerase sigma factor (TIGR02999 family)
MTAIRAREGGVSGPADQTVIELLDATAAGEARAAEELLPLVYDELRRVAQSRLAAEPPGQTLQATALVHEAYLRLVGDGDVRWDSRRHFFASAARAMRRILIDRARRRGAQKHGGGRRRIDFESLTLADDDQSLDHVLAVDEALVRLAQIDERKHEIVMLRYFAGLTIEETARGLGLSATVVKDDWYFARAWLQSEISSRDA